MTIWKALEGIVLSEMSDREKQILYELTYMWNLETLNSEKQSRMKVAKGLGGGGPGEILVRGYELPNKDE